MFGILKKKLSKAIQSISKKFEEKEEVKEEPRPEPKPELKIEAPKVELSKEIPEEVKEIVEEFPEVREEIDTKVPETSKEQIEKTIVEEIAEKVVKEISMPVEKSEPIEKPEAVEEVEEKLEEIEEKLEEMVEGKEVAPLTLSPEILPSEPIQEKPEEKKKKGFFIKKVFDRMTKRIVEKKLEEKDLLPVLEELETDLIESDVAVEVAEKIKSDLLNELVGIEMKRGGEQKAIVEAFRKSMLGILDVPTVDLNQKIAQKKPIVILFIGFNGAGKTTSIAKVANWLKKDGKTSVLAAADTFRAASIEQLEEHANKIGVKIIKHTYGADPAAVVYDAVEHAKAKGLHFVLADSAGRVHTNENLMAELEKVVRVNKPDLKVLVIDSLTGNDAILQARAFGKIGVDAVIFTKVDVNEKGGTILSVTHELKKPIMFLGMGQEYDEFEKFDAEKFVNNVLS